MKRLHGRKNWIVAQKKTLYRCKGVGTVIFEKSETHTPRLGRYDRSCEGRELSSYIMATIAFYYRWISSQCDSLPKVDGGA